MLVKLGDVWVDPRRIDFLEPQQDGISVSIVTPDKASITKGNIGDFAKIVNEALTPKQSWSEEDADQTIEHAAPQSIHDISKAMLKDYPDEVTGNN